MPLYRFIFLAKCDCMSEEALKVVQDNGHCYLTKKGLYLRMFGRTRAPSLLPKYTTDYVIHKEVVRQLYIDGVGNFLFEQKKAMYPTSPVSYRELQVLQSKECIRICKRDRIFSLWRDEFP